MSEAKGGLKSLAEGRSDIYRVDPHKISVRLSWNGRDFNDPANIEHVNMLASSIKAIGVKEPLTVTWENGKAWLVDGECRLRAALQAIKEGAELKTIPVKAEDRYANESDQLFSQVVRNSGKPFSAMERAKVFKRLLDMGWKQQDIATKSGLSGSMVSQVLNLLMHPEPIKAMISAGQVSASMATAALKEHGPAKAVEILKDAIAVANADGSAKAMPKHVAPAAPAIMPPPSVPLAPVEQVKTPTVRGELDEIVRNAFEYADVDDSNDDFVVIKLPCEQWEAIRKVCKL